MLGVAVRDGGLGHSRRRGSPAQDAFVAALEQWPRDGVPDRPGAWLMAAARNRAIDRIRREPGRCPFSAATSPRRRSAFSWAPAPRIMIATRHA